MEHLNALAQARAAVTCSPGRFWHYLSGRRHRDMSRSRNTCRATLPFAPPSTAAHLQRRPNIASTGFWTRRAPYQGRGSCSDPVRAGDGRLFVRAGGWRAAGRGNPPAPSARAARIWPRRQRSAKASTMRSFWLGHPVNEEDRPQSIAKWRPFSDGQNEGAARALPSSASPSPPWLRRWSRQNRFG